MANGIIQRKWRNGFSLVEVAVALAIFSTGLGSFALLLLMAIQETSSAGLQAMANSQARSMAGYLHMLPGNAIEAIEPMDAPSCLEGGYCPPGRMAGAALYRWQSQLGRHIPGGSGLICFDSTPDDGDRRNASCDGSGNRVVKVFWSEPGRNGKPTGQERRVVARLPLP